SANIYRAPVPIAGLDARQLYVNGKRAIRARNASPLSNVAPYMINGSQAGYIFPDSRLALSSNTSRIELASRAKWKTQRCLIASATLGPWHNIVALSNGSAFTYGNDWLYNSGQGVPYRLGDFNGD